MDRDIHYAAIITTKIQEIFEEEIDWNDFNESDEIKAFLHALATMVPCSLYNRITGDSMNHLQFNHLANQICFEKMTIDK